MTSADATDSPRGLEYRAGGPPSDAQGVFPLTMATAQSDIRGRLHLCPGDAAILWVFGAGGGFGGPAGGLYERLAEQSRPHAVAPLELDHRHPVQLRECVQDSGASQVAQLSPRPILFVHGEADEILPSRCSVDLYAHARQPKELILYPGCLHGLDQCRDELDRDLAARLRRVLELA